MDLELRCNVQKSGIATACGISRQKPSSCAVLQEIRLLDREYFKFLFRLVKRKAEEPFSPPSSMRRTEPSASPSTVCPDSPDHMSSRREAGADEAAERLIELAALFLLKVGKEI